MRPTRSIVLLNILLFIAGCGSSETRNGYVTPGGVSWDADSSDESTVTSLAFCGSVDDISFHMILESRDAKGCVKISGKDIASSIILANQGRGDEDLVEYSVQPNIGSGKPYHLRGESGIEFEFDISNINKNYSSITFIFGDRVRSIKTPITFKELDFIFGRPKNGVTFSHGL